MSFALKRCTKSRPLPLPLHLKHGQKRVGTISVRTEDSLELRRERAGSLMPFIVTRPRRCFDCRHRLQSTSAVVGSSRGEAGPANPTSPSTSTGSRFEAPPSPPEVDRRRPPPRTRRQRTAPATPIRMRTSATPEAHDAATTTTDTGSEPATRGAERPYCSNDRSVQ